ncbi:MAG TPA: Lrp/AsnC ligand binding domain-containing protein [Thermoplasmataceae archaeon]|nr:Lrp/AsnC ligand binding domain-containing protein [Thermoplasmatales archaeon AK]HLH86759.1 Lrp/AsnC ligand binding domain-containing protein [Thermoplasmataceae archaeon]
MDVEELTATFGKYYTDKIVTAIIGVETDVNRVENVASVISEVSYVEDVFIVTGDYDLVLKVRFPNFEDFQEFLVNRLAKTPGVKRSKTMMVLGVKKEMGQKMMR